MRCLALRGGVPWGARVPLPARPWPDPAPLAPCGDAGRPLTSAGGPVSAHVPVPGGLQGVHPHPATSRLWQGVPPQGYPRSARLRGRGQPRRSAPPAQSVLFPAAPRGQRARRRRCHRAGCQGAAICVRGAARLGGPPLPPQPPHLSPGALQHCRAGCPQNSVPRARVGGGAWGGVEDPAGGKRGRPGCLPAFLCGVPQRGHRHPLRAIVAGQCCHPLGVCAPQAWGSPLPWGVVLCLGRPCRNRGRWGWAEAPGLPRSTQPGATQGQFSIDTPCLASCHQRGL